MRFKRAVVVLKDYLGDAVMVTPLLDCLRESTDQLTVLAGDSARAVLSNPDHPLDFIRTERKTPTLPLAKALREGGYDAAFLVNRSFRSALASRLAGIPVRVGHATEGRGFLLSHRLKYDKVKPEAACYNDLAVAAGLSPETDRPCIQLSGSESEAGKALLLGATVAIQPGARYESKRVPIETLAAVARKLQEQGLKIAMVGGATEGLMAAQLAEMLDEKPVDLVGKCSIRETMSVLANVKVAIGGDTGVMHLAAGVGCPTVTVFGPTPSMKWGHHYPPHQVVQTSDGDIKQIRAATILEAVGRAMGE